MHRLGLDEIEGSVDLQPTVLRLRKAYERSGAQTWRAFQTLLFPHGEEDDVDHSTLWRIANRRSKRPHPGTLAKIEEALKAQFDEDPFRVAAVHTVFAMPAILALEKTKGVPVHVATVASYRGREGRCLVPDTLWSKSRWDSEPLKIVTPDLTNLLKKVQAEHDSSPTAAQAENGSGIPYLPCDDDPMGWSAFCSGAQVRNLWRQGDIDMAVVNEGIFRDFEADINGNLAIPVARLCYSTRGLALVTLLDPVKCARKYDLNGETRLRMDEHLEDRSSHKEPSFGHARAEDLANDLERWTSHYHELWRDLQKDAGAEGVPPILCPDGTFARQHIEALEDVLQNRFKDVKLSLSTNLPGGFLGQREAFNIGEYERVRDKLFDYIWTRGRDRSSFGITIAVWEPFSTMLRSDWDHFILQKASENEDLGIKRFGFISQNSSAGYPNNDFTFSIQRAVGRVVAEATADYFPAVTMELYARKTFLDALPTHNGLEMLSDYLSAMRKAANELEETTKNQPDNDTVLAVAQFLFSGLRIAGDCLSEYAHMELRKRRAKRAIAACHFEVQYHGEFLDYLENRLRSTVRGK
ncbi:hypothetical protein AUC45_11195 [Erythrobacter sp. YT30]|nr:hypothetical protein AUC45_11195 [Erythrobacter sp. YT30]